MKHDNGNYHSYCILQYTLPDILIECEGKLTVFKAQSLFPAWISSFGIIEEMN